MTTWYVDTLISKHSVINSFRESQPINPLLKRVLPPEASMLLDPMRKSMEESDLKGKKAVAVKYEMGEDRAPQVIAKGKGHVAQTIIDVAQEHGIPLYEDKELSQVLEALDLDTEIPNELFKAVAEVLAFIYRMNKKI